MAGTSSKPFDSVGTLPQPKSPLTLGDILPFGAFTAERIMYPYFRRLDRNWMSYEEKVVLFAEYKAFMEEVTVWMNYNPECKMTHDFRELFQAWIDKPYEQPQPPVVPTQE